MLNTRIVDALIGIPKYPMMAAVMICGMILGIKATSTIRLLLNIQAIKKAMRTIANADRIVVLDDGKIVEQGMPEELIADNGLFKKMVDLQSLSGEWQI